MSWNDMLKDWIEAFVALSRKCRGYHMIVVHGRTNWELSRDWKGASKRGVDRTRLKAASQCARLISSKRCGYTKLVPDQSHQAAALCAGPLGPRHLAVACFGRVFRRIFVSRALVLLCRAGGVGIDGANNMG